MESKYHSDDKCAARVVNFVVLMKPLSSVGGLLSFAFSKVGSRWERERTGSD